MARKGWTMEYTELKQVILGLFDGGKLQATPDEWGFFNEEDRDVRCIGYATNLTQDIIRRAADAGVDFLLTHHDSWEFIYGLKERCNQMLKECGITHAFFHAPLDDAEFGTSASLAKALGMEGCEKAMPYAGVYLGGVIGEVRPMGFSSMKAMLEGILQEEVRCFQNNQSPVRKIAVAAGAGNMTNEMRIAVEQGCDTYITGEYVLYSQQYAEHTGMNLFVGSHTNTEILGVAAMAGMLGDRSKMRIFRIAEPNF